MRGKPNQKVTGKLLGPSRSWAVNQNPHTAKAPLVAVRYLFSCGYKTGVLRTVRGGWMHANCFDRVSGAPVGPRWIRRLASGGFDVRREEPLP